MNKAQSLEDSNRNAMLNDIATAKGVGSPAKEMPIWEAREAMVKAIAAYMVADSKRVGYVISPTMKQVNELLSLEPLHNEVAQVWRSMVGLG